MENTTVKNLLLCMRDEFDKNYSPPKNRSELTEEEELLSELEFYSIEAFKLGLKLGSETFPK